MNDDAQNKAAADSLEQMEKIAEKLRTLISSQSPKDLLGYIYGKYILASMFESDTSDSPSEGVEQANGELIQETQFLLEYVHAVLASTDEGAPKGFSEAVCEEIYETARALRMSALMHCMFSSARTEDGAFGDKTAEIEFHAKSSWVMLRGNRYQVLEGEFYSFVLEPHDAALREVYGAGANEIASGFQAMADAIRTGHMEAAKTIELQMKTANTSISAPEKSREDAINAWAEENPDSVLSSQFAFDDLLRGGICNMSRHTSLPKNLLGDLSYDQGEEVDFFAEGAYRGTPLRTLPARKKPLIMLGGEAYAVDPAFARDSGYRALLWNLLQRIPDYKREFETRQKEMSEAAFSRILTDQLSGAKTYQEVWHRDVTTRQWAETDTLIVLDDVLIIVEAKAGAAATIASPALDFERHIQSVQDLVVKAYKQCQRFMNYLASADEVPIYQRYNDKYVAVDHLQLKNYRVVLPIGLTVEAFSPFSAMCKELPEVTPLLGRYPFISLSIDDLMVLKKFLPTPGEFMHYMEVRQSVAGMKGVLLFDEIDHLGAYLTKNRFDETIREQFAKDTPNLIVWDGMCKVVDTCFEGDDWQVRPLAAQKYPSELLSLLTALNSTRAEGWLSVESHIRSYGEEGRNNLASTLKLCRESLTSRPSRYFQMVGEEALFIWLQRADKPLDSDTFKAKAAAAAIASDARKMIAVLATVDAKGAYERAEKVRIDVPKTRTSENEALFDDAALMRRRHTKITEPQKHEEPTVRKLRRNEPCWCGSGKKFKKCHGS